MAPRLSNQENHLREKVIDKGRASSAPPPSTLRSKSQPVPSSLGGAAASLAPHIQRVQTESRATTPASPQELLPSPDPVDLMAQLHRSGPSVVKGRTGSVLSRGFILKTDHYPSGRALDLELNVHGAPNFRSPRQGNLNVYGVAQPRTQGLRAILSILRCRPNSPSPTRVVWFCTREEPIVYISGRPFVLRDSAEPRRTLKLSDRAENLEAIELRLKNDILVEASRFGGLILTHNEVASEGDNDGPILPTWTAVDTANVRTTRELMEGMRRDGWNVEYHRIPISPDRPIEDNYLDAYVRVIKATDPLTTALVFNCGMGAVRTTFAMVAACIVRRQQLIVKGMADPYETRTVGLKSGVSTPSGNQATDDRIVQAIEQQMAQQDLNRSLLRIAYVVEQCLESKGMHSAIELLLTQPALLDSLRKAHMGNYGVILGLLGCLEHGLKAKKLVDKVIDACDQVTNLREEIFMNRVKYSLTTSMDEAARETYLTRSAKSLEKYFFIISFASYVNTQTDFQQSFGDWLNARSEIWNQITFLRKSDRPRFTIFAPISDLSSLSRTSTEGRALMAGQDNDVAISGGQILGDEFSDHVVKNRSGIILREGTLLKSDQWLSESHEMADSVRGAINFRNVPGTTIYALGQPSLEAMDEVVGRVRETHPNAHKIMWITLREEPIVYINGAPYCLRREKYTLRNLKDYGGISASRLEALEDRLKDDVIAELKAFGGRLLLHTETSDGTVIPVWEEVAPSDVSVLKDVMASRCLVDGQVEVNYARIPITAERPPDYSDLTELMDVVLKHNTSDTPIVQWLASAGSVSKSPLMTPRIPPRTITSSSIVTLASVPSTDGNDEVESQSVYHSYQIINNLLRVIRKGPTVKRAVDDAIDLCAEVFNLRDSIEEARSQADQASDERIKKQFAQKGLHNLRRYFELIIFQAYLQSIEPDTMRSFETIETFVKSRPVIKTFEKELAADGINALKPLERADIREGMPLPDEVKQVVANRSGVILSASTMLKSDFFSNLQKMSLPERIDGSPNFRRVPLALRLIPARSMSPGDHPQFEAGSADDGKWVCGSGMPTVQGLRRALSRIDAGPGGHNRVLWTSLREEPVIYVSGRPHVLRLTDRPLENVEATGVTTAMVETMEASLKKDVLREVRAGEGRILLHDEVEERPGVFSIVPIWEHVSESDIMTPRDVFDLMTEEGYNVDYDRVAVTDEQAPLPDALFQLYHRVKSNLATAGDFVFNCQMGRGRTTTGMITACLIATMQQDASLIPEDTPSPDDASEGSPYDSMDGPSEEEAYLQGEYKTILHLVGVLSHGKMAKHMTDRAIDHMQDVQNLRKAVYDYKLKVDTSEKGSAKQMKLLNLGINYLYRYGTLIVFANYLIEMRQHDAKEVSFPAWLHERREITTLLSRRSLD
ncbi:hypothetical protein EUX98_g5857 [Antrodiella citrinella]|uniref:Tyrosine specific protein phosphatases domain-containing protein n=1 Tax=Antrodiella citrinella TaxID=2447956 RepID=A0A4S4MY45_9APHY|nr:hypothetical protein EUX98_g5857 [Antrodiella citrinella]